MKQQVLGFLALAIVLLQGCEGARGDAPVIEATVAASPPDTRVPVAAPAPAPHPAASSALRSLTRVIDKDSDGDGIANRRIIITEVFDPAGELVERIREQDFEADGIVDAREVTHFGGATPIGP
ncbi:MAG TPA: hypothetical protein VFP37_01745 [Steroidobacteraceae bacterium]|nr:hypothetical protein [Steroidobacteraceae bacterium]